MGRVTRCGFCIRNGEVGRDVRLRNEVKSFCISTVFALNEDRLSDGVCPCRVSGGLCCMPCMGEGKAMGMAQGNVKRLLLGLGQ